MKGAGIGRAIDIWDMALASLTSNQSDIARDQGMYAQMQRGYVKRVGVHRASALRVAWKDGKRYERAQVDALGVLRLSTDEI
jgi:hypothetical protein